MARTGRKPLAAGHVEHLEGSPYARQRLQLMLECMQGLKTVSEACRQLDICESRFHALRNQWLQEALELLEPRQTGRPPKPVSQAALNERLRELETENAQLRQQLRVARVQVELHDIEAAAPAAVLKNRTQRQRDYCARC